MSYVHRYLLFRFCFFLPGKTDVFTQPMYINKYLYCITTLLVFFFNFFGSLFVCSFARTVAIFATTIITTNLQRAKSSPFPLPFTLACVSNLTVLTSLILTIFSRLISFMHAGGNPLQTLTTHPSYSQTEYFQTWRLSCDTV